MQPSASKKIGSQSWRLENPPVIVASASIVGEMEGQGPFGRSFDYVLEDSYFGEKSWEKAESKMLRETVKLSLRKSGLGPEDVDFMLAGDLLNQIVAANFAARELNIPFLGLYGACSTMAESLAIGSMLIDGGFASRVVAASSSHHETAERQYRFPTELGTQRPPWSQWTVTGAGAVLLAREGRGPVVTHLTLGKVMDLGATDANDMGSAMAPAAADTLISHFKDTGRQPGDYDLMITGDLGKVGLSIARDLLQKEGFAVGDNFDDCGVLIYYPEQDAHAGGSGCGCSAVMLCGPLLQRLADGNYQRILLVGTGALLSPLTVFQGETIPAIAHLVVIERR
ncbi:MAG: stage V sporulation protein AD [Syntrophomonadaceae bacterium]|nr:stage V sporulation protein AD [Syntrophomonadaceae bacterium]